MKTFKSLLVLSVAVCLYSSPSFGTENIILSSYAVPPQSVATMKAISSHYAIEGRTAEGVIVYVPAKEAKQLLALAPNAKLIYADIHDAFKGLHRSHGWVTGYHDFDHVQSHLQATVTAHPDLAFTQNYGKSQEGRPLVALRLTGKTPVKTQLPEVMITGATHGNELISTEVVLGLMDELANKYGTDARLTRMLDTHVIYFIPVVNPDGFVREERLSNGVDPNRDYPYPVQPNRSPNACIKAIMDFVDSHHIVASEDFHSYGELMMYPWAYSYNGVGGADQTQFRDLADKMVSGNHYEAGQISQVLYTAPGSSADYYYWKHQSMSFGVEIGTSFVPPASQIKANVQANMESTWQMIEHSNSMAN